MLTLMAVNTELGMAQREPHDAATEHLLQAISMLRVVVHSMIVAIRAEQDS